MEIDLCPFWGAYPILWRHHILKFSLQVLPFFKKCAEMTYFTRKYRFVLYLLKRNAFYTKGHDYVWKRLLILHNDVINCQKITPFTAFRPWIDAICTFFPRNHFLCDHSKINVNDATHIKVYLVVKVWMTSFMMS